MAVMAGFLQRRFGDLALRLGRVVFRAFCLIPLLSSLPEQSSGATVAVLPVNREANSFSDALTASLSQVTNIVTLERAEIERVLREHELSLAQPQSIVRAGKLLN